MDRRRLIAAGLAMVGAPAGPAAADQTAWPSSLVTPRVRVISDNDYGGDPDGLVQLAHLLLSGAVDIRAVIGSHLRSGDPFDASPNTADKAATAARQVVALTGRGGIAVMAGSNRGLIDRRTPIASVGAKAIVAEALLEGSKLPLYVTCGAGLTEIASAWLMEPRIAERLTLIWIGGHEHEGLAEPPPGAADMEYNLAIDPIAAQVVFNDSDLRLWQVPRDAYRSMIVSRAELIARLRPQGALGRYLFDALARVVQMVHKYGLDPGETYVLGDSPLVLLTALMTTFEPTPASSSYVIRPCPRLDDKGLYDPNPAGRPLRVYIRLDTRILFEDLFAKLQLHAAGVD